MKNTPAPVRIVITGSESTGKSVLTAALAEAFSCPFSDEAARIYVEEQRRALNASDVEPIARRQIDLETNAIQKADRMVIHDTDLWSTVVYAEHYYGQVSDWLTHTAGLRSADFYLLCDIDLPWIHEPLFRDQGSDAQRTNMHERFVNRLEREALRWAKVTGSGETRVRQAADLVQQFIDQAGLSKSSR